MSPNYLTITVKHSSYSGILRINMKVYLIFCSFLTFRLSFDVML